MPSVLRAVVEAAREGNAIVHRKHKRAQQRYGPDRTPVDEVFAVLAGSVECLHGRRWLPAGAGDVVCVRRGRLWGVRARRGGAATGAATGEVRLLNLMFLARPSWCAGAPSVPTALPAPWWRRLLALEARSGFDAHGQRVLPIAEILDLVGALARAGRAATGGPVRPHTADDWMATWIRAEEVIRARAAAGLTADQLARAVHCSPTQLRRIFRSARGTTPKAAITAWRVDEARRLLASGRWTATQVAAQVGFATVQRFHAVFRRAVGMTPGAFGGRA
ncbi:MAG TPA: helix-turn-helix transcriptional regulator [Planctomycetota bacterium]|nr:helix-turn-helix transcriptional regulator [Planctomycetota bacterium]